MGSGSSMAALGSWGEAQIQHSAGACPSPALQNPLYRVRERPAEPTLPPAATLAQQKAPRPASLIFDGFPLNSQPCSAYGIQLRDQGSRFHLIHPQNHQVRGFQVTAHWLETEPGQGGGAASQSSPGTGQTRDSGVSISARTPHASKKGFSLFSFLPAQKSQHREGPVTPLTAFLLISFSMSELAGSQLT